MTVLLGFGFNRAVSGPAIAGDPAVSPAQRAEQTECQKVEVRPPRRLVVDRTSLVSKAGKSALRRLQILHLFKRC